MDRIMAFEGLPTVPERSAKVKNTYMQVKEAKKSPYTVTPLGIEPRT
jgi:hypothetical protein